MAWSPRAIYAAGAMAATDLQPTLTGDTIVLRPLREEDFELLYACASDPLIWEQHPQSTRYQRDVFRRYFDGGLASGGALVVVEKSSGEVIGSSRYYDSSPEERVVSIGYTFLARRCWGGAVNREMKMLMLRHAFQFADRVLFEIGAQNRRSRRALEKLGATLLREEMRGDQPYTIYVIDERALAQDAV